VLQIIIDALAAGRVTEDVPGPTEGYVGASVGRFVLADPSPEALAAAVDGCPSRAIRVEDTPRGPEAVLDEGRCVFCGLCAEGARPAFRNVPEEPSVAKRRSDLVRRFALPVLPTRVAASAPAPVDDENRIAYEGNRLSQAIQRRFRRSLQIRHLDAGGCNGCEWELNQLQSPRVDLQRFGYDFVASPRHADLLMVTGVVTRNLELALVRTLDAMPRPRLVVAMGACAISGGIFGTSYASLGGADRVVAVDAYLSGCPPRPWAVLRALRLVLE
jgi:Ni,Fe-hydrogenase III small subunit/ferredoxin